MISTEVAKRKLSFSFEQRTKIVVATITPSHFSGSISGSTHVLSK
jgi:hypothetical protein